MLNRWSRRSNFGANDGYFDSGHHSVLEMDTPRVSVCIPAYNAAAYLREAMVSVLEQSYRDFEIVVVDNCSTDQTATIVDQISKDSNGCVRYFKNENNIGLVPNLNRCLTHARGQYIKFLCADDMLLPGCIETMVASLEANPSVTLVACARQLVDAGGYKLGVRQYASDDILVRGDRVITRCLFGGNYIGEPSAVMFRRADVERGFREDMPQLSDIDMWFQLLEKGDFLGLAEPFCAFRSHSAQMTHANVKLGMIVEDNVRLFDAYSHKPYVEKTFLLVWRYRFLMTYRVWVSRAAIKDERRKVILGRYASPMLYRCMPLLGYLLRLQRQLTGADKINC